MGNILQRYLFRDVVATWLVVTAVLLMILLTRTFADYLGEAAAGKLPPKALFSLVLLFSVQYLTIVIPLSLFLAILLALGRWYRDSEMAALVACGGGPSTLLKPIGLFSAILALLLGILSFEISPLIVQAAERIERNARQDAAVGLIEPGRFRSVPGGSGGVFYVEGISEAENPEDAAFKSLFIHLPGDNGDFSLVTAERGRLVSTENGARALQLNDGQRFDGTSGKAAFSIAGFNQHQLRLVAPKAEEEAPEPEMESTLALFKRGDQDSWAELHGRLAIPLALVLLMFLAIPFAQVPPRSGRLGRLLPALLLFFLYFSLIGLGQEWLQRGKIPSWVGLWWVHLGFSVLLVWQWASYLGWRLPWAGRNQGGGHNSGSGGSAGRRSGKRLGANRPVSEQST